MTPTERADCRWELRYRAAYSGKYHRRRGAFFDRCDKLITIIIAFAGASTFIDLISGVPDRLAKFGAAAVTFLALVQIIVDLRARAEAHRLWMKRWATLGSEMEQNSSPTDADIARWLSERDTIESECIVELRALCIDCENEAARVLNLIGRERKIKWWQRAIIELGTIQREFPFTGR